MTSAIFRLAGEVFEQARAKGGDLESAMREADRVLRASRETARVLGDGPGAPPTLWRKVFEVVAAHHRVTVDAMQLRGGGRDVVAAREEAAGILSRTGVNPEQIGNLLRRDRYVATAAIGNFAARMETDAALRARVEQILAALAAPPPATDARRPAVRAERPAGIQPLTEGEA